MRIGLDRRSREAGAATLAQAGDLAADRRAGRAIRALVPLVLLGTTLIEVRRQFVAEEGRWFPWAVVAFAAGSAAYFAIRWEPSWLFAAGVVSLAVVLGFFSLKTSLVELAFLCLLAAAAALGFGAAKLRTERVAAPVIARDMPPSMVVGRIQDVNIEAPNKTRIVLELTEPLKNGAPTPDFVRLTVTGAKAVATAVPGRLVSALAVLRPPPEPAMPGGYDFARWAYFQQLGGVGYTYGAPKTLEDAPVTLIDRFNAAVEKLRLTMTARVQNAIPGPDGEVAASLITGERGEITEDDNDAYRDSGLAHVLSISGVHLALAGLGIFWALRALLPLWPQLALHYPIKKWAALAALLSSTFYLTISGGGSPAVRSYLMLSAMLLGVLADRPALSMRAVALAALVILVWQPEDVIDPSFQMSFAAVVGLIALAEWGASRPRSEAGGGQVLRFIWRARHYVLAMLATSLVATLASTPFAIYHFDRAGVYSLLANLLAEPIVAFVIMPSAAVSVIAMPFGSDYWPLQLMGWGVHEMTAIAHWVAGLPGAAATVRAWPAEALAAIVFGGLWIALWRKAWRWWGLVPIALAAGIIALSRPPDILIARDVSAAAVRLSDGKLAILGLRPDEYTASQWLQHDGDTRDVAVARTGARCDEEGCVAHAKDGRIVALSLRASALVEDCMRANIVIAALPIRRPCVGPAFVLQRFDITKNGAAALSFVGQTIKVETVAGERGLRPWSKGYNAVPAPQ